MKQINLIRKRIPGCGYASLMRRRQYSSITITLQKSFFPTGLKQTDVGSTFKKYDKNDEEIGRPVSILLMRFMNG